MNAVSIADDFREAHDPHWVLKSAFQLLVFGLVFTEVMLALAVRNGFIWLAALLVIVAAHLMHGTLIGLPDGQSQRSWRLIRSCEIMCKTGLPV